MGGGGGVRGGGGRRAGVKGPITAKEVVMVSKYNVGDQIIAVIYEETKSS